MAKVDLTRDEYKELVQLLAEWVGLTVLERQHLLENAGLAQFQVRLDFNTDARLFASQLVNVLQQHGNLQETGQPALVSLLEELRGMVRGHREPLALVEGLLVPYGGAAHPAPPPASATTRLLFLSANPMDTPRLRLDEEVRTIKERLREAQVLARFTVAQEFAVRTTDLARCLLEHRPQVVHFAGHGEQGGALAFEDEGGNLHALSPQVVADLLRILKDDLRVILFNACWSEQQATALVREAEIPVVIGMARPIEDHAAIAFAGGFYRGVGFGRSIQTAFELGCNELAMRAPEEQETPRLLAAPGIDAAALRL